MYSVKELARALRRHPQTVREWSKEGKIPPPIILGVTHYWTDEDLACILAEGRAKGIRRAAEGQRVELAPISVDGGQEDADV